MELASPIFAMRRSMVMAVRDAGFGFLAAYPVGIRRKPSAQSRQEQNFFGQRRPAQIGGRPALETA